MMERKSQMANIYYLGVCLRYQPPLIGVHYKNKLNDQNTKIYTILLNKLVLNPDPYHVAHQLYLEHPHILKEDKIPITKIASFIAKIHQKLQIHGHQNAEYLDEDFQETTKNSQQRDA